MNKLFHTIGAFVGSSVGWAVGNHFSMMTAVLLSAVGTGVGIYFAHRLVAGYF